jgi:hypothetical protein
MDGKVKGTTGALTLEMVKIAELKMLPSNTKIHSQKHIDKIVRSIKEFGFKQLILITMDSFIIAGHCRYTVGKKLRILESTAYLYYRSRATLGTICSVLVRGASCNLILV